MFPHVSSNGCGRFEGIVETSASNIDFSCSKDTFEQKRFPANNMEIIEKRKRKQHTLDIK